MSSGVFMLPKNMLWIERLFSHFPINKGKVWRQMLARLGFLFGIWVSGLLVYVWDGLMTTYISELTVHLPFFVTLFLILFGSYFVQNKLDQAFQDFRPMLNLDDKEFQKFSEGLRRVVYSFVPCVLIALVLVVSTGVFHQFVQAFTEGFSLHSIWNLSLNSFGLLLTATAMWMFAAIWITIFSISRQPLDVTLSSETLAGFRELSLLALWFAFFYFVGVSIGNISFFAGAQSFSVSEILLSPYLFFIAVGVAGILFPFYNIHTVLLKMKQRELSRISEESELLLQQLDEALNKQKTGQPFDNKIEMIHYRLFGLQIKEKRAKAAKEWPIDMTFISKLLALVLIPILSRILAMLIIS